MQNLQKLMIVVACMLYGIGCSDSNSDKIYIEQQKQQHAAEESACGDQEQEESCSQEEPAVSISAYTAPDYVRIMEVAALSLEGVALDIALSEDGKFAYIATGDFGLSVVDISDPYNPALVSMSDTTEYVNHVEVIDGKAYVSYAAQSWEDYKSVDAFDISDPYHVVHLGHYEGFQTNGHKLVSEDGLVYYVDTEGFKVVREEDYSVIGRYDLFDTAYAFALSNGYAYVANGRNGLTVLKVD